MTFPYIHLSKGKLPARLSKYRGSRNKPGEYFGPFAMEGSVKKTINIIQKAFLLRTCTDSYYQNRQRPCLLFKIKKCSGPCTNEISEKDISIFKGPHFDDSFIQSKSPVSFSVFKD